MSFYGYEDKLTNLKNNLINSEVLCLTHSFKLDYTSAFKVFTIASGLISFNILFSFL